MEVKEPLVAVEDAGPADGSALPRELVPSVRDVAVERHFGEAGGVEVGADSDVSLVEIVEEGPLDGGGAIVPDGKALGFEVEVDGVEFFGIEAAGCVVKIDDAVGDLIEEIGHPYGVVDVMAIEEDLGLDAVGVELGVPVGDGVGLGDGAVLVGAVDALDAVFVEEVDAFVFEDEIADDVGGAVGAVGGIGEGGGAPEPEAAVEANSVGVGGGVAPEGVVLDVGGVGGGDVFFELVEDVGERGVGGPHFVIGDFWLNRDDRFSGKGAALVGGGDLESGGVVLGKSHERDAGELGGDVAEPGVAVGGVGPIDGASIDRELVPSEGDVGVDREGGVTGVGELGADEDVGVEEIGEEDALFGGGAIVPGVETLWFEIEVEGVEFFFFEAAGSFVEADEAVRDFDLEVGDPGGVIDLRAGDEELGVDGGGVELGIPGGDSRGLGDGTVLVGAVDAVDVVEGEKVDGIFLKGGGADDLGGAPRAAGVIGEGGGTPEPNAAALAEGILGENQEARGE